MKIVTMSTLGTGRLVANLLASCQLLGIDHQVELYCDAAFYEYAKRFNYKLGIQAKVHERPSIALPCNVADWGSCHFMRVVRAKLDLLVDVSHPDRFEPFLYLDADTVFLHRLPQAWPGLAFQSDARDFEQPGEVCMGCVCCMAPARSVWLLAQEWIIGNCVTWQPAPSANYFDDQTAVNQVLPAMHRSFELLDPALWLNGARAFDLPQKPDVEPILVHANWRIGAKRKEAELRAKGWWLVSDESLARCGL